VNPEEEKRKGCGGKDLQKRQGMKVSGGDGIPSNSKYDCWQIKTE